MAMYVGVGGSPLLRGLLPGGAMPEARKPYKHGDSQVVALPRSVREHLGVEPGDHVYFHAVRGGEVVLAATSERRGGRPEGLALVRQLAKAKQRIRSLEERVRVIREAAWNEFRAAEAGRVVKLHLSGVPELNAIHEQLRDISAQLGLRSRPRWSRRPRGRRRVETVPGPDSVPLPGAPSSPSAQVPEEGAAPARQSPDPLPSSGLSEERGDGAERPLSGHPMTS